MSIGGKTRVQAASRAVHRPSRALLLVTASALVLMACGSGADELAQENTTSSNPGATSTTTAAATGAPTTQASTTGSTAKAKVTTTLVTPTTGNAGSGGTGGLGGSGGTGGSGGSGGAPTTLVVPTTPTTATVPETTTTIQKRPRQIAYPSGGARGPVFPPNDPAYEMLRDGPAACTELLEKITSWGDLPEAGDDNPDQTSLTVPLTQFYLYRSAAQLCVGRWKEALDDFRSLQALGPTFDASCDAWHPEDSCDRCLAVVHEWTKTVVAEYLKDPAYPPTFVAGAAADQCATGTPPPSG